MSAASRLTKRQSRVLVTVRSLFFDVCLDVKAIELYCFHLLWLHDFVSNVGSRGNLAPFLGSAVDDSAPKIKHGI